MLYGTRACYPKENHRNCDINEKVGLEVNRKNKVYVDVLLPEQEKKL
jgi:hypothetical protein